MRIKKQYTRDQLEAWPVRKIKRTFMIARQAMFTKMRLIDKVMKKMGEVYPKVQGDVVNEDVFMRWLHLKRSDKVKEKEKEIIADIPWQTRIVEKPEPTLDSIPLNDLAEEPLPECLPIKEQLQNTKWLELLKLYGIPVRQGINKQKAIEMILTGELKLKQ